MAEFLEDPSVLTKDKLKNELTANNVALPSGEHKKEVYVQLYLKNLTVLNTRSSPPAEPFSSDDELPTPVVSNRSRSGRKAARKTDRRTDEMDVTELTDEELREQLVTRGGDAGPIVASTRKLYEKKLQKVLDEPDSPSVPEAGPEATALADQNQNGNTHSDQYSDKEDEEMGAPEPVPVVEKAVRSRGKIPASTRTSSRRQTKVAEETLAGSDLAPSKGSESVVEDILANEISTPMGISATCRRPIRGAAGRPLKPSEYWLDQSLLQRGVHRESHAFDSASRGCGAESSGGRAAPARRGILRGVLRMLLRMLLLVAAVASLYYAYCHLDAQQVQGLLEAVVLPLQGALGQAAAHLGLADPPAEGAAK